LVFLLVFPVFLLLHRRSNTFTPLLFENLSATVKVHNRFAICFLLSHLPTMWPTVSWLLTCVGIFNHLANAGHLPNITTVAVLPDGRVCPVPDVTTVSVVTLYVSTYLPGATQIEIFGDGNTIIFNGPTTIITSTVITTTIFPTATVTMTPSITGLPDGGALSSGASSTGSASASSTSGSSGPSSPAVTSRTATSSTTSGATLSYSEPIATLGQGLPTGIVTSLPPGQGPIILGFAPRIQNRVRRQASANAQPTAAGYLRNDDGAGGGCGYAARWGLENGMLVNGNRAVGKARGALFAAFVPSDIPAEVSVTFYFNNGILGWNTTDVGPATFYTCGGNAFAGFPSAPFSNCTALNVGGVDADVCPVDVSDREPPSSTFSSSGALASTSNPPVSSAIPASSTDPASMSTSMSTSTSMSMSMGMNSSALSMTSFGVRTSSTQGTSRIFSSFSPSSLSRTYSYSVVGMSQPPSASSSGASPSMGTHKSRLRVPFCLSLYRGS